jgi:hypothetical protein
MVWTLLFAAPTFIGTLKRRLNHDELRARIDANVLTICSYERKLTPGAGKQPQKIAITEIVEAATRAARPPLPWVTAATAAA